MNLRQALLLSKNGNAGIEVDDRHISVQEKEEEYVPFNPFGLPGPFLKSVYYIIISQSGSEPHRSFRFYDIDSCEQFLQKWKIDTENGWASQIPLSKDEGLVSKLHRNSAYLWRRAALVSTLDTSGHSDKVPVLVQSCRTSNVRIAILRAPTRSAWSV
jgi:hypothetical protein